MRAETRIELLKQDPAWERGILAALGPVDDEAFNRIRCPLCQWQPAPSSIWSCQGGDGPEPQPFFTGCGTVWNTFLTRGRCPGCNHQWRWTVCLRCAGWSLHVDWYEVADAHNG
jgi:hypothetical protein